MIFSTVIALGTHHRLYQILKYFCHAEGKPPYPVSITPQESLSQPLATSNLHSVFMDLAGVDISHKWAQTIFRVWFPLLNPACSGFPHTVACIRTRLLLGVA